MLRKHLDRFGELAPRVQQEIDDIVTDYKDYLIYQALKCETPIEQLVYLRFMELYFDEFTFFVMNDSNAYFNIYPQKEIEANGKKYRVDFAIEIKFRGRTSLFAIECDDHEFHEKTKEQALRDKKRDRDLMSVGYYVMRFTGSEIWNDPEGVVIEIYDLIKRLSGLEDYVDYQIRKSMENEAEE